MHQDKSDQRHEEKRGDHIQETPDDISGHATHSLSDEPGFGLKPGSSAASSAFLHPIEDAAW
jgi:hypothetical protein